MFKLAISANLDLLIDKYQINVLHYKPRQDIDIADTISEANVSHGGYARSDPDPAQLRPTHHPVIS